MLDAMSCIRGSSRRELRYSLLIGEREYRRPGGAVVLAAVMPAAVGSPDRLELLDDPVDAVGEQPGERQESKRPELLHSVVGQRSLGLHDSLLVGLPRIISRRPQGRGP